MDHMTDARAAAVDAAAKRVANDTGLAWAGLDDDFRANLIKMLTSALATRDARMAEAGWVMVRDCGEVPTPDTPLLPSAEPVRLAFKAGWAGGWNDCRAAMLGSKDDATPIADALG